MSAAFPSSAFPPAHSVRRVDEAAAAADAYAAAQAEAAAADAPPQDHAFLPSQSSRINQIAKDAWSGISAGASTLASLAKHQINDATKPVKNVLEKVGDHLTKSSEAELNMDLSVCFLVAAAITLILCPPAGLILFVAAAKALEGPVEPEPPAASNLDKKGLDSSDKDKKLKKSEKEKAKNNHAPLMDAAKKYDETKEYLSLQLTKKREADTLPAVSPLTDYHASYPPAETQGQ